MFVIWSIHFFYRGGDNPAIEIWDMTHIPFVEKILYDLETINDKVSVEGLVWVRDRLFSCGLHGFIVEHDLCTRKMKVRRKYIVLASKILCGIIIFYRKNTWPLLDLCGTYL